MDLGLQGKVVVIMGGLSGLGRVAATAVAREGAHVALAYRREEEALQTAKLVERTGGKATAIPCDPADFGSVQAAVKAVIGRYGMVHALIHTVTEWDNQGGFLQAPVCGVLPPEPCGAMVLTSVHRAYQVALAMIAVMRARGWGRIVYLSANEAETGKPGSPSCPAARVGLQGLTRRLALDWGPTGIMTNVVMVGPTLTDRAEQTLPESVRSHVEKSTFARRLANQKELSDLVAFLGSPANGYTNGQVIDFCSRPTAHHEPVHGCWASLPVVLALCRQTSRHRASLADGTAVPASGGPELLAQVNLAQRLLQYDEEARALLPAITTPAAVAGQTQPAPGQAVRPNRRTLFRLPMYDHPCTMRLVAVGDRCVTMRAGEVSMIDLSGGGCQIATKLDLPADHRIVCEFLFQFRGAEFRLLGEILHKQSNRGLFTYGVKFIEVVQPQRDLLMRALNLEAVERRRRSPQPQPKSDKADYVL